MTTQDRADRQLAELTRDDWAWILYAVTERAQRAAPRPGEPPMSRAHREQVSRITMALMNKAHGR